MGYEEERKHVMTGVGGHGQTCRVCWILGVIFAVVGVIAAAANVALGLGATNWLLLAIAAFLAAIGNCIPHAAGLCLHALEAKGRKEEGS